MEVAISRRQTKGGARNSRGRVLEIGVDSGLNLPLYGNEAEVIIGLDPSEWLLSMAQRRAAEAGGLRSVAESFGVDASNLRKMVSGERKLTPRKLVY